MKTNHPHTRSEIGGRPLHSVDWLLHRGAVEYWLAHPRGTPPFGVRSSAVDMLYFRCKDIVLNIRDGVSLVGRGWSVRNLGKFVYPTSFG